MTVGERIKELRTSLGISQVDFADKIGISKQLLYKYEANVITNIPSDKLEIIADALYTTPAYLMGWESNRKKGVEVKVYGKVAAGIPLEMIEDIIDTEEIPEKMARLGEHFGLKIKGDSMEPRMVDGDVVIVRQQEDADTGDVVIATINGDSATCKKLKKFADGIALISTNPKYDPMYFSNKEVIEMPVRIIGKVVELRCKY